MVVIQRGGALQGTCRRCSTFRPQNFSSCNDQRHCDRLATSLRPFPHRFTPQKMSLLPHRCLGMGNSFPRAACPSPSPQSLRRSLQSWYPWKPRSCRVLQPTFLTKWWQNVSHFSCTSSNYGISCTLAGNKTPDCRSFWEMSTHSQCHSVFLAL